MRERRPELGKWLLWKWFYNHPAFHKYLPETRLYSPKQLRAFLSAFQSIYIKPVAGARGQNVMCAAKEGSSFILHIENHAPLRFSTFSELEQYLQRQMGNRRYIVQRDVRLAKIAGRPFDIRIMMQKDAHEKWQCTGLCAKVAGPHSAVTNIARSHGVVLSVAEALRESLHFSATQTAKTEEELRDIGIQTCSRLEEYQSYSEIGVDVGIDRSGRPFILEQNTGPSHALFRHMSDQTDYLLIQKTWRERKSARSKRKRLHRSDKS